MDCNIHATVQELTCSGLVGTDWIQVSLRFYLDSNLGLAKLQFQVGAYSLGTGL